MMLQLKKLLFSLCLIMMTSTFANERAYIGQWAESYSGVQVNSLSIDQSNISITNGSPIGINIIMKGSYTDLNEQSIKMKIEDIQLSSPHQEVIDLMNADKMCGLEDWERSKPRSAAQCLEQEIEYGIGDELKLTLKLADDSNSLKLYYDESNGAFPGNFERVE